jgi:hypothetical protein
MGYGARDGEYGNNSGAGGSPGTLGRTQPDPWVHWYPRVGRIGVRCRAHGTGPEPTAVVAERAGLSAPNHPGVERAGLLREAGDCVALAGCGLSRGAGGCRRSRGDVLPAGSGSQRARHGTAGGGASPGSSGGGGGSVVAGEQRRLRRGPVAGRLEVTPQRVGLGAAVNAGGALQHHPVGPGDGPAPRGHRRRGCGAPVPQRGCSPARHRLGMGLARRRTGRGAPARPHGAPAWRDARPGVGIAAGATRPGRVGGVPYRTGSRR